MNKVKRLLCSLSFVFVAGLLRAQADLETLFHHPPASAKPWVFWYWMQASVSREGIHADLLAMKEAGIGGAYLMPIKGKANPPLTEPPVEQLTPEWWRMINYAMQQADSLGLQLAMHVSDGFALAGGPWIKPEQSMQKLVWTTTPISGGTQFNDVLPQPESNLGYYQDVAVLAFPSTPGEAVSSQTITPVVTTSKPNTDAAFLAAPRNTQTFSSEDACWIQYRFDKPFTCRSIIIRTNGNNYQSHRLRISVSDDGEHFRFVTQLQPPRAGWQDGDADVTHVIAATTARFFRFSYDKAGSEPGAEDLDAAKWKPVLKIKGIELSGAARINQYEGKTGAVWRIGKRTTATEVPDSVCVPLDKIIDLTAKLQPNGQLQWQAPAGGQWTVLRIGHTSTGHTNATGGGGKGLECDKFNPEAVQLQFDHWFGEVFRQVPAAVVQNVLKIFHVDSWECGSQNWSTVFSEEFKRRRGYSLFSYLPVMAGIPVQSADVSERFLHDVRQTIAELVHDNFYNTLAALAHAKGCAFSAESVAPTMLSDGMLHYEAVDIPMGEFWLRSPTHDKPNDMLDAISGAHLYGKPIVQAEAFTELRMAWDEHPAMLKALQDRNYAMGINRLVYHVFAHNPWLHRKPGMTLDGIGLYFQRDQTWWKPGQEWVRYAQRCQALLQQGVPVTDIAVFTGEELPRRALLPERLVNTLPGLIGKERVQQEQARLRNTGEPLRQQPEGVTQSANIADPQNWVDPLQGYAYDSFNSDALLRLAKVQDGRITLPGGASYGLLVLPQPHAMDMDDTLVSPAVAQRLLQLVKEGAMLMVGNRFRQSPGLYHRLAGDDTVKAVAAALWKDAANQAAGTFSSWSLGKGRIVQGPLYTGPLDVLGLERDVIITDSTGAQATGIAWTHRRTGDADIYFISNQQAQQRIIQLSLRVKNKLPEIWNPVTGETTVAGKWQCTASRTLLPLLLEPNGSLFVVLRKPAAGKASGKGRNWPEFTALQTINGPWQVQFDTAAGGPVAPVLFSQLADWSKQTNDSIRYYSGTALYRTTIRWNAKKAAGPSIWLQLGEVNNMASVQVNGVDCGVAWTAPYRVNIGRALRPGVNELSIAVTNTWANRLTGDQALPEAQRITHTTAPIRLQGKPLLKAGLIGPVRVVSSK